MKNVLLMDLIDYYRKRNLSFVHDEFDDIYYRGAQVISDKVLLNLVLDIETDFQKTLSTDFIWSSIKLAATSINSCQNYLTFCNTQWDGVNRIDNWLSDVCDLGSGHYSTLFQQKFLIGAVARAMKPGCKMDTALILEGPQGVGKSSLFATLFGRKWFTDAPFVLGSTNSYLLLRKKWVVELAEMKVMSAKNNVLGMKGLLTQIDDSYRSPYGRLVETHPRKTIFVGSTNESQYLTDITGNRRYWPVYVSKIDLEYLTEIRQQLWGEAFERYKNKEPWWFDETPKVLAHQVKERIKTIEYTKEGVFDNTVVSVLKELPQVRITSRKLLETLGMQDIASPKLSSKVREVAENNGWKYTQVRDEHGFRVRGYTKADIPEENVGKPTEFNFV